MKIGIDISQTQFEGSGVARFTEGLVRAIKRYGAAHEWTFIYYSGNQNTPAILQESYPENIRIKRLNLPIKIAEFLSYSVRMLGSLISDHLLKTAKFDWFITSDWIEWPSDCKKATIVHDLVFKRYPETLPQRIRTVQSKRLAMIAKDSTFVFCDSDSTKSDLIEFYPSIKERVVLNYPGAETTDRKKAQWNQRSLNLKKPYILAVGKLEPRKNIERLIEAFDAIKGKEYQLAIVGADGWGNINRKIVSDSVKFLGFVPDDELFALYNQCEFFVYPSLYEGFGYPVVEAMSLGVPVATSNTSSLKEIAGDAAELFNPENVQSIKKSIEKMMRNNDYRKSLSQKGFVRAQQFSWKKYYNTLIQHLETGIS